MATASANPRRVAWVMLTVMVVIAWAYIAVLAMAIGLGATFGSLGPGMAVLDRFSAWAGLDAVAFPLLASSPWLSRLVAACTASAADWSGETVVLHVTMWLAMGIAMMLPTATPMLRTYAEIADTAAEKGRRVVSPVVLALGYLTIWSTFAVFATGLEWVLGYIGAVSTTGAIATTGLSIAVLAGAGIYQFTNQKAACLIKCSNPFPFLFANWTERAGGVFRLGLREGLHCLACCWALMLVMFAVGTMNIVWIAILTVVMTVEKLLGARWFSRAIGVVLLAWAAAAIAGLSLDGL
ncbi:DUF2182 domain-containing protein [Microbaculum marinisediminis]|uniref:DUF2182 domain-containing protein n=1 Tax=Microbaculum marinisediminis TaxID=2931392 RepID=A0AAW5R3X7_9HYPH|nr:DUF2182 domain-containing protein [Microbaculum sp. A6E488]MCT8974095.1 DUF2182 domain-containing protein [Microbaculum sp. A6E488]